MASMPARSKSRSIPAPARLSWSCMSTKHRVPCVISDQGGDSEKVTKQEVLKIARAECERRGWPWNDQTTVRWGLLTYKVWGGGRKGNSKRDNDASLKKVARKNRLWSCQQYTVRAYDFWNALGSRLSRNARCRRDGHCSARLGRCSLLEGEEGVILAP